MIRFRPYAAAVAVAGAVLPLSPAWAQAPLNGQALFTTNCSACHQPTGMGIPGAFPALAGDPFVLGDPSAPAKTVLEGRGGMPNFKPDLTDDEIAAILSYVRSSWGNKAPPLAPSIVSAQRIGPPPEKASAGVQIH